MQTSSTVSTLVRIGITIMSSSPTTTDATAAIDDSNTNDNMTAVPQVNESRGSWKQLTTTPVLQMMAQMSPT
jgi:hypothetical protein